VLAFGVYTLHHNNKRGRKNEKLKKFDDLFFLIFVLTIPFSLHIAYAQDTIAPNNNEPETVIATDGYDPQQLQPTRYPDLEQTGQNILKIWGGPYLTADDQICFSYINTSSTEMPYSYDYVLETKINDQWYQLLSYKYDLAGPAFFLGPGNRFLYIVSKKIQPIVFPGKHRIVLNGGRREYGEFEIVEPGSDLQHKPQNYDWQFLHPTSISHHDKFQRNELSSIVVEGQPVPTTNRYIRFNIDIIDTGAMYWRDFYFEVKIDDQWYVLTEYYPDKEAKDVYFAIYQMPDVVLYNYADLTSNKVMLSKVWAPAGPFAGTHRLWGNLVAGRAGWPGMCIAGWPDEMAAQNAERA